MKSRRTGPPNDSEEDQQIDTWTEVIPLQLTTLPTVENE